MAEEPGLSRPVALLSGHVAALSPEGCLRPETYETTEPLLPACAMLLHRYSFTPKRAACLQSTRQDKKQAVRQRPVARSPRRKRENPLSPRYVGKYYCLFMLACLYLGNAA